MTGNNTEKTQQTHSPAEAKQDPSLFEREAVYTRTEHGKIAEAALKTVPKEARQRDLKEQRNLPGKQKGQDASHLIGDRFGGRSDQSNLDPWFANINRGSYKHMVEDPAAKSLKNGENVFLHTELYGRKNGPTEAVMAYTVTEKPNGDRTVNHFSFQNARSEDQQAWADIVNKQDMPDMTKHRSVSETVRNTKAPSYARNAQDGPSHGPSHGGQSASAHRSHGSDGGNTQGHGGQSSSGHGGHGR